MSAKALKYSQEERGNEYPTFKLLTHDEIQFLELEKRYKQQELFKLDSHKNKDPRVFELKALPKKLEKILAIAVIAATIIVMMFSIFLSVQKDHYVENLDYQTVVVESGDSIWSIASNAPVSKLNTKEVTDLILSKNTEIEGAKISSGQQILVPYERV